MGAAASMVPPDAELELFNKLKAEYGAFLRFFPILNP
jgi:hypothetical protein